MFAPGNQFVHVFQAKTDHRISCFFGEGTKKLRFIVTCYIRTNRCWNSHIPLKEDSQSINIEVTASGSSQIIEVKLNAVSLYHKKGLFLCIPHLLASDSLHTHMYTHSHTHLLFVPKMYWHVINNVLEMWCCTHALLCNIVCMKVQEQTVGAV
jgi:hypothetical protein